MAMVSPYVLALARVHAARIGSASADYLGDFTCPISLRRLALTAAIGKAFVREAKRRREFVG